MAILVTLLHGKNIYHIHLEPSESQTFGGKRRDSALVPGFNHAQITVMWKNEGISIVTKPPFQFQTPQAPLNEMIVIDEASQTGILLTDIADKSVDILRLPLQCMVRIGRSQTKGNMVVVNSRFISGNHCLVRAENDAVYIEDLHSVNGVFVNGSKVERAKLSSGDTISLMNFRFVFKDFALHIDNISQSVEIQPVADVRT